MWLSPPVSQTLFQFKRPYTWEKLIVPVGSGIFPWNKLLWPIGKVHISQTSDMAIIKQSMISNHFRRREILGNWTSITFHVIYTKSNIKRNDIKEIHSFPSEDWYSKPFSVIRTFWYQKGTDRISEIEGAFGSHQFILIVWQKIWDPCMQFYM